MTELSLIIPAYNEASAIEAGKLTRVATWLTAQALDAELIVVDDGSQDATAALAQTVADQVIRIAHAGKAAAIVAGIQAASGKVILFTDMDQAIHVHIDGHVHIGSRFLFRLAYSPVGNGDPTRHLPRHFN